MALYSPHCSFLPHHLSPDHSPSRHCAISQALHALLPPLLLQQHSSADLGVVARIQPFTLPGAQPAAFSSGSTSTEQGYGRDPSYGTALSDTESPDKASSPKAVETYSLSLCESQEPNLAAANVLAADTARVPEEGELVAKFSKKAAMGSTSRSRRSFELKQTYLSDAREATATTVSQAREKEPSFDSKPAVLVRGDPADGLGRLPINLDLDLYRARCLFRSREYKKAETILRQCVKDWPSDGRAYVFLGTRLMKQGKFVDARAVFEDGCQAARGENPFIWQAWAVLEQKLGHISEARKLFDAATAADIRHAAAWHGWAILELQQGSTRKARELLSKGLKYCGGNEYLYQTSALIEYRAGKVEEARALFSQAIQYNPKSCASWLAWALLESDKGNNSTARYLFQRGIRASPKNRYAWQAWALFESNQGNKDWARRLFQQGVELNPNDAVLLQAFALFEYNSSNPVMARELFDRAASVDPKHQPVWNARGWVEWKEGNLDMARQYYKKSLSINSRSVDAARTFHAWAVLEEGAGNYSAARELFKCTLRVDSQNVPAWTSWAKLEENVGNGIRAEEIRMQYLQQRTEVVDEAPWDVTFSSMLVPAFTRIKEFLRIEVQPTAHEDEGTVFPPEIMEVLNKRRLDMDNVDCDTEFDIEAFIREVLPWKNKLESRNWKERPRFLNITNVAT